MSLSDTILLEITTAFSPVHVSIDNESGKHAVAPGSETHFKVTVVSELFSGQPLVTRHRAVNAALVTAFQNGLHALSLTALTPEEWQARDGRVAPTPACLGGSKRES